MYRVGDFEYKTRWHWYSWKLKYDLGEFWFEYKDSIAFGLLCGVGLASFEAYLYLLLK